MESLPWGGTSALDPRFLATVKRWIEQDGEVYVIYWYAKAAGSKDHYLFTSYERFLSNLTSTHAGLPFAVDVYRHPQFPVRGWVDDDLIKRALAETEDQTYWALLIFEDEPGKGEAISTWGDRGHIALMKELQDYPGRYVVIGPDIHWSVPPAYPGEWMSVEMDQSR
jgi:hypothetical protein